MNGFELLVKLLFDDSDLEKGINNAGKQTESLSAKTVAMGQMMADAIEGAITKVAEFGKQILDVGIQQEQAFAKVNTIMNTSVMDTDEMASAIKSLSSEMGVSVAELSDTVYNAISATGDTANAIQYAEQASKLATAGFTDTSSALGVLTTAMNAYGDSAGSVQHISDSLITVQNLGVTTVAELSSSMGKAIASASAYGVNLENLESAYISITKAGINTAEGTTYISSMMKELGDNGSTVSGILQEVTGKAFNELMAEGASLGDVLQILSDSVDNDSTALMNLWSSAEAGKASSAIMGQSVDLFNENLNKLQNTTSETETAFKTMSDTISHKLDVIKSTFENKLGDLFENFGEPVKAILDGVIALLGGDMDEGTTLIANGLNNVLTTISSMMPQLSTMLSTIIPSVVSGITDSLPMLLDSGLVILEAIGQSLLENLPMILEAGVEVLMSLIEGMTEALPELLPTILEVITSIVEMLIQNAPMLLQASIALMLGLTQGLIEALPTLIDQLPVIIQQMVDALAQCVPMLVQGNIALISILITHLPEIIAGLIEAIPSIISSIIDGYMQMAQEFLPIGETFIQIIAEGMSNAGQWIQQAIDNIKQWFDDLPVKIAYALGVAVRHFVDWVVQTKAKAEEIKTNIIQAIITWFTELPSKLWTALLTTINRFQEFISNLRNKVVTGIPSLISRFVSYWTELPSKMADIGRNVIQGLWNGISDKFEGLLNDLRDKISKIKEAFTSGFDTHSPSRWFKWLGEMNVEGFKIGMDELLNPQKILSDITDTMNSIGTMDIATSATVGAGASGVGVYNQTVNINQRIATPDELARQLRLEARYGLMRGVTVG